MSTKKLFILLASILVLAFSVSAQPAITWFPTEIDFGTVPVRTSATAYVTFNNTGTGALQVTPHAEGTCFNVPTDEMITLQPDDSAFVVVTFSPDIPTDYTGTLFLTTNDPEHASVQIPLSGTGGIPLMGSLLVSVVNLDSAPISGAEVTLYSYASESEVGQYFTNTSGQVLVSSLDVGAYNVSVTAADFRPQSQYVYVSANNQATASFELLPSLDDPTIHVVDEVNFGQVPISATHHAYVFVMNLGNETLEVDASVSGSAFTMHSLAHFEIAAADSEFVINLSFTPPTEGDFDGTLTLTSNDPEHQQVTIDLYGTGIEVGDGNIEGFVLTDDPVQSTPVENAYVTLDYIRGGNGLTGPHLTTFTAANGAFSFENVVWGVYSITASKPGFGFASEIITINEDQTTHLTLTLLSPMGGDSDSVIFDPVLEPIELSGTAIVEGPNADHNITWYFLDVDNNGTSDYQLSFGPPWYEPASGATRPTTGDHIEIGGGLMSYGSPPIVVVYVINGQAWTNSIGSGHGGNAGNRLAEFGCDANDVSWIELNGTAQSYPALGMSFHGIDTDNDGNADYILDYGTDYGTDYWELIPTDGETVSIIGGLVNCDLSSYNLLPWVIVYEIDTELWRMPGDTTGMSPIGSVDAAESVGSMIPSAFEVNQNYPNPFNPVTTIEFSIPNAGFVDLKVYDITGREVESLFSRNLTAGKYSVEWNGITAPSGLYFYRVSYGNQQITRRMLLLK